MVYFLSKANWSFDWFTGPKGTEGRGVAEQVRQHPDHDCADCGHAGHADAQFLGLRALLARAPIDRHRLRLRLVDQLDRFHDNLGGHDRRRRPGAADGHQRPQGPRRPRSRHVDNSFMFYAFTTAFVFITIGVNIVANFVSAAFDISNINPRRISFRTGGLITDAGLDPCDPLEPFQ